MIPIKTIDNNYHMYNIVPSYNVHNLYVNKTNEECHTPIEFFGDALCTALCYYCITECTLLTSIK